MLKSDSLDPVLCESDSEGADARGVEPQYSQVSMISSPHLVSDYSPDWGPDPAYEWLFQARTLFDNGWKTIFPQERSGARRPILAVKPVSKQSVGIYPATTQSGIEISKLGMFGPESGQFEHYLDHSPYRANVALVLSSHSGGVEAADFDTSDPVVLKRCQEIAVATLGATPFVRVGRAPKEQWFYRRVNEGRQSKWLLPLSEDNAVEYLTVGNTTTLLGRHYRTGRAIQWTGAASPMTHRPEDVPVVTWSQVEAFRDAISREFGIAPRKREARPTVRVEMDESGTRVPPRAHEVPGVVYDPVGGKVIDGRDGFLFLRVGRWMSFNRTWGEDRLVQAMTDEAREWFAEWDDSFRDEIRAKVRTRLAKVQDGTFRYARVRQDEDGSVTELGAVGASSIESSSGVAVLLPPAGRVGRDLAVVDPGTPDPEKAKARALVQDRAAISDRVSREIHDVLHKWMSGLYELVGGRDPKLAARIMDTVRLLKAPTGSGKTVSMFRVLAEIKKARGALGKCLLMTAPTHENLREMKAKAVAMAAEVGVDLNVVILKGASEGGCLLKGVREFLAEKDVGASGLCFKKGEGGKPDRYCEHYHDGCPVIANRLEAAKADLVLAPDAFVAVKMPRLVRENLAGVCMDERWWDKCVSSTTFPLSVLETERGLPTVTGPEKRLGVTAVELTQDRDMACRVVLGAIKAGESWEEALYAYDVVASNGARITGVELCVAANKVSTRTADKHRFVEPNMTLEGAKAVAGHAVAAFAFQEARFWKIAEERVRALRTDRLHQGLARTASVACLKRAEARGTHDHRVQVLDPDRAWPNVNLSSFRHSRDLGPQLRISWRTPPNFASMPALLLDASADTRILGKLFAGRQVKETRIEAPLHMRTILMLGSTMPDRALLPTEGQTKRETLYAARNMVQVRRVLTKVAGLNGHGRVAFCANKGVKDSMADAWAEFPNVDLMHFCATRGLDFAKYHDVAMSVGRMELPARAIDGLVAALTYDDDEPEAPIDLHGTGQVLNDKGQWVDVRAPEVDRTYGFRDGRDVVVKVPEWSGDWARRIQRQYREEELLQFAGRLRPVYRETDGEPPVYVCLSKVCHPDLVIDEAVSFDDIAADSDVWEAIRRTNCLEPRMMGAADLDQPAIISFANALKGKPLADDPRAKGLIRYEFFEEGSETPRHVLVPATDPDPSRTVFERLYSRTRIDRTRGLREVDRGAPKSRAEPRPTDVKFEQRVGTWQDRRDAEERQRIAEVTRLLDTMDASVMGSAGWGKRVRADDDRTSEVHGEKVSIDVRIRYGNGRRIPKAATVDSGE